MVRITRRPYLSGDRRLVGEPPALFLDVVVGSRPPGVHGPKRLEEDPGDREVAVPLPVTGDDQPRGMLGVGLLEGDLVGLLVLRPQVPFVHVAGVELPEL